MANLLIKDGATVSKYLKTSGAGTDGDPHVPEHTLGAGEAHIGEVAGKMATVYVEFTRPSDTTAYAAKDAISNNTSAPAVLTFTNLARVNGGSAYIVKARLMTNLSTDTKRYRLHIYHTAPTPINDNSPFTLLWANRTNRLGYIDFPACATEGTGSDAAGSLNDTIRHPFVCASGSRHIYGLLETLDAGTPGNAQAYYIELTPDLN